MKNQLLWSLGIVGLALFVLGIVSVTAPNMTVATLMLYFGIMLLIIGGIQGAVSLMMKKSLAYWPWLLFISTVFVITGYYMIKNSNVAAAKFTTIMASWAIIVGIIQLIIAVRNKQGRIFLISMGIISLFFGSLIFLNPFTGTNTIQFIVGFYTLLLSIFILYMTGKLLFGKKPAPQLQ
jgi:uncharacterized membrane protein HdeD (DUF308 family)